MADEPRSKTLIDLVAVAISPVLVMLMLGSLVHFIITVLPTGPYKDRLLYTFFFFVIGAVLIARITIQLGWVRASIYAVGLGVACFVAMFTFVEWPTGILKVLGPIFNLLLMGVIWWSAHKLTWDCTHLDEDRKASGKGVLAAAGMDQADEPTDEPRLAETAGKKKKKPAKGFDGWLDKYQRYRKEQQKKAHTPGVWVLYFALAALPLFALGQAIIPADDGDRRQATLMQMAVYIGSALGLLVTTTLMGLRKYLEDRNAKIPPVMVGSWLGIGAGLIIVFLAVGAALPRPHSETPIVQFGKSGKGDRKASKYAQVKDGAAGQGGGTAGQKTTAGQGKNSAKGGEQSGGKAGEKGAGGGQGKQSGGKSKGDQSGKSNDQAQSKNKSNDNSKSNDDKGSDSNDKKQDDAGDASDSGDAEQDAADKDSGSESAPSRIGQMLESISGFIKWLVWIIVAIAVIAGIVLFFLKWLAPFTNWARNILDWLKGLFGPGEKQAGKAKADDVTVKETPRPPPFSAFPNPFANRSADRRTIPDLVEYSFAAFDSWAWDRDLGRQPGETPTEFAVRIGHEFPDLDEPGFAATELVARVLYSRSQLPADAKQTLEALWDHMDAAVPAAASRR